MTQYYDNQTNNRIVKEYFSSGVVLFRAVLEILMIGALVSLTLASNSLIKGLFGTLSSVGVSDFKTVDTAATSSIVSSVAASIPMLLTAIAYILIFVKSRSDAPYSRPDAGLTILNVFAILRLVGAVVLTVVVPLAVYLVISGVIKDTNPATSSYHFSTSGGTALVVATLVAGVISLIMAIVYKLYIGSINKTAKSNELSRTGAKAWGVFSVLMAIEAAFSLLATVVLPIIVKRIPEWVESSGGDREAIEAVRYLGDHGTAMMILMIAIAVIAFVTYIVDAAIALGYNRHIKEAEYEAYAADHPRNNGPYGDAYSDDVQTPAGYRSDAAADAHSPNADPSGYTYDRPSRKDRSGYGDRFIDD